jgi:hypothetical protein
LVASGAPADVREATRAFERASVNASTREITRALEQTGRFPDAALALVGMSLASRPQTRIVTP